MPLQIQVLPFCCALSRQIMNGQTRRKSEEEEERKNDNQKKAKESGKGVGNASREGKMSWVGCGGIAMSVSFSQ